MKRCLIIFLIPLLFSCGGGADLESITAERDSLLKEAEQKDEALNDFMRSLNEIESNLSKIKEKENIIRLDTQSDVELDVSTKDRINDDILSIYELMLKNKQKLDDMQAKISRANIKTSEFQKMVKQLNSRIERKDREINQLKDKLVELNINIDSLNVHISELNQDMDSLKTKNVEKTEIIDKQTEQMNTAYYVYGTAKELKEQQVITKEGGFIGLGRMAKLMENFNKDYFTKIDIRKMKSIKIFSKKADIITTHPQKSFELYKSDKLIDSLVIKNSKEFWSVSKYLVIVVN